MTDLDLIRALGGPRRLCELLGYDERNGGLQRIYNWVRRGNIPYQVKVKRAAVFELALTAARKDDKPRRRSARA